MNHRWPLLFAGLLSLVFISACAQGGDEAEMGDQDAPAETPAAQAPAAPDTTGAAIWAHIQDADYQSWARWPGLGDRYQGQEPHGALLTTYVNDIALNALQSGAAMMPAGAVIIKDNFGPDGTLMAVTTMLKAPGFNADHSDWFFTKHLANGELDKTPNGMDMEGRLMGCQNCHTAQRANDYLFNQRPAGQQ